MVVQVRTEIIEAEILEGLEPKVGVPIEARISPDEIPGEKEPPIEAVIVEDLTEPIEIPELWSKRRKRKKPRGTRMKDYPDFIPKIREKILNGARLGMPVDFNAYFAGIHPDKLKRWLKFGVEAKAKLELGQRLNKPEQSFADFETEYQAGVVQPIAVLLAVAFDAARKDGSTAIKLLEKLAPEQYGPKGHGPTVITQIAVSQQGLTDGTSDVHKKLSTGTLRELRAIRQKQLASGGETNEETN